jgi:hypothetical protein
MYAIRDAEGKFVGSSRSKESAHRSSRTSRFLGSSVNRAGAFDPHALRAADQDMRAAKRHGSLMIGQTRVGTVELRYERPDGKFALVKMGSPTEAPEVLARGSPKLVRHVLAKLYVVEYGA